MYDGRRGEWVACERCSGTGRASMFVYEHARPSEGLPSGGLEHVSGFACWPTWEEYQDALQDALREHPDFMLTEVELDRANELGLYDDFFELAILD